MSQKVRKTLIMIVMAALIICLMAASLTYTFTYGRYTGGKFDEESPYDDLIEFVGAREYTVRSPEELIQAIEDGYSNIVIAEDAEEPFVITEGVTDVTANLVLNLNGKTLIRNSRNPMLDVQTNVSVVLVYDSTNKGAFYNPVGSSLMASGGSLTVGSGGYESGPRAEEYENGTDAGTLSQQPSDVTIYTRDGITSPSDVNRVNQRSYTKIKIDVSQNLNLVPATSGRYYRKTENSGYTLVPADTFLIYTVEENCFIGDGTSSGGVTFESGKLYVDAESETVGDDTIITASEFTTPLCNVASCDFYYYYPISGTAGTDENPQDYAVIYGYWDVMKLARDDKKNETDEKGMATALKDSGLIYPYGAVRMVEGEGIVRGGTFNNHFDAVNTYGIYAEGGTLSVSKNTKVDTTFTTGGEGVCIRVQSAEAEDKTTGGSLTISGGEFSSAIGNTIEMSGGNMTVTEGKFTKSAARSDGNDQIANQTAIIDIEDGTLKIEGKSANSVTLTAGSAVKNPDGTVTYSGTLQNVFGIRAEGGTVTTSGCTFHIYGDYSAGVLSYDGKIDLGNDTAINVKQSDQYENGNNILLTSAGVSSEQTLSGASENEEHPVNISGDVTITSNGLGITARGAVNVTEGESTVTTTRGTGIYVNNGSFTVDSGAAITVNSTVKSDYSWATPPGNTATNTPNIYNGVYVQGGSLDSKGMLNVTFTGVESDAPGTGENNSNLNGFNAYRLFQIKSYAVRVEAGTGANTTVKITSGNITNSVGGGVLVNGGTVELGTANDTTGYSANNPTGLTVQTTGTELYYDANSDWISNQLYDAYSDRSNQSNSKSWKYLLSSEGGPAIKIVGGTLKVNGGKYTAQQGDGIVTNGGSSYIYNGVFIGKDSYTILDNDDGISFLKIEGNVTTTSPLAGPAASYAFKVYSGTATVYGGTFGDPSSIASGAFVMGTEDSPGTANIFGGTFDVSDSGDNGGQAGFSAYVYTNVTFTEDGSDENGTGGKITVQGLAAGLTLESAGEGSNNPYQGGSAQVIINSGSFSSMKNNNNSDGIWYGNGSTTLNISGGTFTGAKRSGLYFDVHPTSNGVNHVTLSGGTYYGSNGAINADSPGSISTGDICWEVEDNGNRISSWLYEDEALNNPITYEEYHLVTDSVYYHIGGEYSIDLDGYLSSLTVASSRGQLNEKSSITISTQRSSGDYYR